MSNKIAIKLRLPSPLVKKLDDEAEKFNMNRNQFIELLLSARYDKKQNDILGIYDMMLGKD